MLRVELAEHGAHRRYAAAGTGVAIEIRTHRPDPREVLAVRSLNAISSASSSRRCASCTMVGSTPGDVEATVLTNHQRREVLDSPQTHAGAARLRRTADDLRAWSAYTMSPMPDEGGGCRKPGRKPGAATVPRIIGAARAGRGVQRRLVISTLNASSNALAEVRARRGDLRSG